MLLVKSLMKISLGILAGLALMAAAVGVAGARDVLPLDDHWRFLQADAPGAEQPGFDDSAWKLVAVRKPIRPAARARFCPVAWPGTASAFRCRRKTWAGACLWSLTG